MDGLAQMRQGIDAMQGTGAALNRVYFLAQLAEVHLSAGQMDASLAVLAESRAMIERTGEHSWEAEVYRLQGELLCRQKRGQRTAGKKINAAAESLQQALAIARQQQARSLELRAAMSLCRLWQQQGKHAEARQLLSTVYSWFTEGFDTADLRAATALLAALRA
jgi:predicted ATPase